VRSGFVFVALNVTCLLSGGLARAEGGPTGIELGVRSGYALPFGSAIAGSVDGEPAASSPVDLSNTVKGLVPLWFDLGYRLAPQWFLGASFQYGFGLLSDQESNGCSAANIDCSFNNIIVAAEVQYHMFPRGPFDPWIGLGAGYEWATAQASGGGAQDSSDINGFNLNVQIGGDYLATPDFGIGPFVMLSAGEYTSCSLDVSANGTSTSPDCEVKHTGFHEWLTLGVRARYDLEMR
jgi:hypothetical protein